MENALTKMTSQKTKQQNIDLIDGTFNASDAADIINAVLDVKINYHKLKRLSITEGNVYDLCEYDNGRINELIQAKENAKLFFNKVRHSGKKLRINGLITIEEIA
ncbi:hypothetical protein [Seonamhaeicola sp.]|uniref:hypothetical protein n=1 Tax=Seonamhaeicola sp. TaxID=1912245 RepID=UPI0026178B8B|nr:hypothetical protein [Seonamhaeicola sp.]